MTRFLAAFFVLSSANASADLAPSGTYVFTGADEIAVTIDGKKLPSCGSAALALMREHVPLELVYASKPDTVRVNNEAWKSVHPGDHSFAQKLPENGDYLLSIMFRRIGTRAIGQFMYLRRDANNKSTCVDVLGLSGSYQRRSR